MGMSKCCDVGIHKRCGGTIEHWEGDWGGPGTPVYLCDKEDKKKEHRYYANLKSYVWITTGGHSDHFMDWWEFKYKKIFPSFFLEHPEAKKEYMKYI